MRLSLKLTTLFIVLALIWATGAPAQEIPPTPQFGFTGFIQEATLDNTMCPLVTEPRLKGGTITVNGIKMIVPCNTILQMPAATFTFAELFYPANYPPVGTYIGAPFNPVPANPVVPGVKTGLALADVPAPFPSFEVSVVGNVVGTNLDGSDKYIVGMIAPIEQQVLNGSSGIISCIDYTNGSFRVGGTRSTATGGACPATGATGALVQINDPNGRWGLAHSIDPRFSGDDENVTVHASTGIPVCIPRVAPPAIDPLCPLTNRPLNGDPRFPTDRFLATGAPLKIFNMPAPVLDPTTGKNTVTPDAYQQAPMMVGDQVNYVGTLYKINPLLPNTPDNIYMSAHTVEDVLGIFTAPGVPPAYVFIEAFLIGSGGVPVQGILQEASTRLTVVGFTTDPTRLVDIYAQDINPCTGQETLRQLATTDPATQPLLGRFVHRVLGGLFMPPTRYYVVKSRTQGIDPTTGGPLIAANGIKTGQYLLPNFEFVVPENHRLGDPIIPANFQDFPFLAQGSGPIDGFGTTSAIVGQLDPWPTALAFKPAPVNCSNFGASPIVNAGPDIAAGVGKPVTLTGSVIWDTNSVPANRTVTWQQVDPTTLLPIIPPTVPLTVTPNADKTTVLLTFTAPAPTTLTFKLTATDNTFVTPSGPLSGSDVVSVTVLAAPDTVQFTLASFIVATRGPRGGFGKLDVTATSTESTAILTLFETPVVDGTCPDLSSNCNWGTGSKTPAAPTTSTWREIKGAPQPKTLTINSSKGGTATVTCGLPDARGRLTCP